MGQGLVQALEPRTKTCGPNPGLSWTHNHMEKWKGSLDVDQFTGGFVQTIATSGGSKKGNGENPNGTNT